MRLLPPLVAHLGTYAYVTRHDQSVKIDRNNYRRASVRHLHGRAPNGLTLTYKDLRAHRRVGSLRAHLGDDTFAVGVTRESKEMSQGRLRNSRKKEIRDPFASARTCPRSGRNRSSRSIRSTDEGSFNTLATTAHSRYLQSLGTFFFLSTQFGKTDSVR